MSEPDKIVDNFIKEFISFEDSFREATEQKNIRFGPAARGCLIKARKYLLEAQECLALSTDDSNN